MRCAQCRHDNPADAKFCLECGRRIAVACPACGTELPAGAKFCKECGVAHLAERIVNSKAALEGERKQVTVLFADLKGSMELLADRDPEEARMLLDPVLEHMMEAVHRYEGTVNQVMGDGIMAMFGAPLAHEDHAVRACYAALRMQASLKRYADDVRRSHGVEVQIRVGLNSGEVVVRSVGSDLRMDYTAVGQTTHLAARMEQLAPSGSARLTEATVRLAEGYVEVRSLGPVPVKGLAEPIEIFELLGAGRARTRLQAGALRGLTRFVGRDAEVEHLRRVLGQASAGHGQVVAVVGEAGVGKSRLTYEFARSHRVQDWLVLEAASASYGKSTSYLPVIDLLKRYVKIGDRDDHQEMRAKVLGRVLGLDRALESLLLPLLALLDVPVDDPAWRNLDAPQRRQLTLDALKRLLLRQSQAQPLLLVFEDLHWIDSETQALLDSLVESLPSARLLLLVTYRPEYEHRWGSKAAYSQLRLDTLAADSATELLAALVGPDPGLVPLTQRLVKRGNPFFLEETVRTLVETGALAGHRGAYRLTRPVEALQVPATVQAILAARIDRLPPDEKQLLQSASVIGTEVPLSLLRAIADTPEEELRQRLVHLQAREFLYEVTLFPESELAFKHGLTQEVAYESLLRDRRRVLHARIVDAIEVLHAGREAEHIERLAHHAIGGELWDRATTYLHRAGERAEARAADVEAIGYFEKALGTLARLPTRTESTLAQGIDIRLDLRRPLFKLGDSRRMLQYLREAEEIAEALGDDARRAWVLANLGGHAWTTGDNALALDLATRAYAIGSRTRALPLQVHAAVRVGFVQYALGRYSATCELFAKCEALLREELLYERFGHVVLPSVHTRVYPALSLAECGQFEGAIRLVDDGVRIAEAADHTASRLVAEWGLGGVLLLRGDIDRAIATLNRGVQRAEETQFVPQRMLLTTAWGLAYAEGGRAHEALPRLEAAIEAAEEQQIFMGHPIRLAALSQCYLMVGRIEDAAATAGLALDAAGRQGERGAEAWILRLLGDIFSRHTPPDVEAAQRYYDRAGEQAAELGMRPLVAHCQLGLGKLQWRTAKQESAREHLATATTLYREMGMTHWLEQAEAEMRRGG